MPLVILAHRLPLVGRVAVLVELEISLRIGGVRQQPSDEPPDVGSFDLVLGQADVGERRALGCLVGEGPLADVDGQTQLVGAEDLIVLDERAGVGVRRGVEWRCVRSDPVVHLAERVGDEQRHPRTGDARGVHHQGDRPDGGTNPLWIRLPRGIQIDRRLQPLRFQLAPRVERVLERRRQVGGDVGAEVVGWLVPCRASWWLAPSRRHGPIAIGPAARQVAEEHGDHQPGDHQVRRVCRVVDPEQFGGDRGARRRSSARPPGDEVGDRRPTGTLRQGIEVGAERPACPVRFECEVARLEAKKGQWSRVVDGRQRILVRSDAHGHPGAGEQVDGYGDRVVTERSLEVGRLALLG